ncbi:unnamed protein product [Spirodela intermedia]|uniref:Protein kinase domain-containing protein n=1 Tax=Spirodela intermedia TaxID=51605 RepID=A0A7I8KSM9_SPIIN|nr:unnamed protein product [Spirodela intermedia]
MKILVLIFLLFWSSGSTFCAALSPDGLTLLAFKSAVSGDPSASLAGWDEADEDPCRWPGVSCTNVRGFSYPRVVALTVSGKNLSGYIPSELGSLVFLRRLNLHGNYLSGAIPPQLSNASSLHSLFLYSNNLSGPLPPSLCDLPRLQNLDLSRNSLSGPIPGELRRCRQLQRLHLAGNRLSGEMPAGIWQQMENLLELDLSSNNLTGTLPPDLGSLRSLSGTLNLSYNQFSGEIPDDLGNLPAAVGLDLRFNNLSGEIPTQGTLSNQSPKSFAGNPRLCGYLLLSPCQEIRQPASPDGQISMGGGGGAKETRKGLRLGTIILIAAADAVGVALIGLALVYAYWKVKNSRPGCSCTGKTRLGGGGGRGNPAICCKKGGSCSDSDEGEESGGDGGGGSGGAEGTLVAIDKGFSCELEELLRASAYVLGKGGMGIMYKVVLGNGVPVAVRRLGDGGAAERRREFASEVMAVARVRHPNLVRLKAYYWSPEEKLLVSEFISNGCLAAALHPKPGEASLSWPDRLRIAKGTARGLAHIHESGPRKLVHGGVKPSNILLDGDLNPHISDLGLARLAHAAGGGGGAPPSSYLPPEAQVPGSRPSQSWDVYAFGVVLLELLTGRSPGGSNQAAAATSSSPVTAMETGELATWARKEVEEGRPPAELVDPAIRSEAQQSRKAVASMLHLALICSELEPNSRPRMRTVSDKLDKIAA